MPEPTNILDARNNLSKIVAAAANGTDTVIAKRGRPVARVTAFESTAQHSAADVAIWLADNPRTAAGQRTPEQLDAQIDAEREGWN